VGPRAHLPATGGRVPAGHVGLVNAGERRRQPNSRRRLGQRRIWPTKGQIAREEAHSNGLSAPRPTEAVPWPEVNLNGGSTHGGGGDLRSSSETRLRLDFLRSKQLGVS
jgi:hypothetical protein